MQNYSWFAEATISLEYKSMTLYCKIEEHCSTASYSELILPKKEVVNRRGISDLSGLGVGGRHRGSLSLTLIFLFLPRVWYFQPTTRAGRHWFQNLSIPDYWLCQCISLRPRIGRPCDHVSQQNYQIQRIERVEWTLQIFWVGSAQWHNMITLWKCQVKW